MTQMTPACIVNKQSGKLLCLGSNVVEANTTWTRLVDTLYSPGNFRAAPEGIRLPGLTALGLLYEPKLGTVQTDEYFVVTVGRPLPLATGVRVEVSKTECVDEHGYATPQAQYFDATDERQGNAGSIFCERRK
jgi:hypothetical protein